MGNTRFFGGSRSSTTKTGAASATMREQLRKGGKIDTAENYKKMLKKKLDEARFKTATGGSHSFSPFGNTGQGHKRSEKAEATIKMMADTQAAKEAKKVKKAVVVEARGLTNGKIDAKGRVYDVAGNQVAQVNKKNGSITTVYGQYVGKYAAKSYMTNMALQEVINKNSPHLLNQRKMAAQLRVQQMQQPIGGTFNSGFGGIFGNTGEEAQTDIFGNAMSNAWGGGPVDMWGNPVRDFWGNVKLFFGLGW